MQGRLLVQQEPVERVRYDLEVGGIDDDRRPEIARLRARQRIFRKRLYEGLPAVEALRREIDDLLAVVRPDPRVVGDAPHHVVGAVIADEARTHPAILRLAHSRDFAEEGGNGLLAYDLVDARALRAVRGGFRDPDRFLAHVDHARVEVGFACEDLFGLVKSFDAGELAVGEVRLYDRFLDHRLAH